MASMPSKIPKKAVIFRLSTGPQVGSGHFFRCLTLAIEFISAGYQIHFASNTKFDEIQKSTLISFGISTIELKPYKTSCNARRVSRKHIVAEVEYLVDICSPKIVVLDDYDVTTMHEEVWKHFSVFTVKIDDFANESVSNVVINYNIESKPPVSAKFVKTKWLVGLRYNLSRSFSFCAYNPKRVYNRALVFFGSGDNSDMLVRFLAEITQHEFDIHFSILINSNYSQLDKIKNLIKNFDNFSILDQSINIDDIFYKNDFFIGSCGVMAWESIKSKFASILLVLNDNQKNQARLFKKYNYAHIIHFEENTFEKFISDALSRRSYIFSKISLFNEPEELNGPANIVDVVELMAGEKLIIRDVNFNDINLIFEWSNDDLVRINAKQQGKIPYHEHVAWFSKYIAPTAHKIYIISSGLGENIGMVRFDSIGKSKFQLTYSLSNRWRGMGLSLGMIKLAIAKLKLDSNHNTIKIFADVRLKNTASLTTLLKAKFQKESEDDQYFYLYLETNK